MFMIALLPSQGRALIEILKRELEYGETLTGARRVKNESQTYYRRLPGSTTFFLHEDLKGRGHCARDDQLTRTCRKLQRCRRVSTCLRESSDAIQKAFGNQKLIQSIKPYGSKSAIFTRFFDLCPVNRGGEVLLP